MEKRNIIECGHTPSLQPETEGTKKASETLDNLEQDLLKEAAAKVSKKGCTTDGKCRNGRCK